MIPGAIMLGRAALSLMLSSTTVSRNVAGTATAIYAVNADGTVSKNGSFFENWISSPSKAANYDVLATVSSGPSPTGTIGSWLQLNANRSWSLTNAGRDDSTLSCDLLIQIRERSTGTVKVSATVTLSATSRGTA
jgi:hypothetical protein